MKGAQTQSALGQNQRLPTRDSETSVETTHTEYVAEWQETPPMSAESFDQTKQTDAAETQVQVVSRSFIRDKIRVVKI